MPTYSYKCPDEACGNIIEQQASMKDYEEQHPACPQCGKPCNYTWVPYAPQFVLKDGATGSWPSKGNRFKQYRAKAAEAASKRQRDRFGEDRSAIPNYNGQETGTWQEAQHQALKDKGAESAATYNAKVAEEKSKKIVT